MILFLPFSGFDKTENLLTIFINYNSKKSVLSNPLTTYICLTQPRVLVNPKQVSSHCFSFREDYWFCRGIGFLKIAENQS